MSISRRCGECSLCCKLVPVKELAKKPNTRCVHQRRTGCNVYARRPLSCQLWSCRWLIDEDVHGLPRPDRSGYVIDIMADYVMVSDEDGKETRLEVVQVWCDPKRRDAWRTPELLACIERWAEDERATLIRYGMDEAITVFAPSLIHDRVWVEKMSRPNFALKPEEAWQLR